MTEVAGQAFQQEYGAPRKSFMEVAAMPNHPDSHYRLGEAATLRVTARAGGVPIDGGA